MFAAVLAHAPAGAAAASGPEAGALSVQLREAAPARGTFLIASREFLSPAFARRVVLLLDYDEQGGIGLIINRPSRVPLASAVPGFEGLTERNDYIHSGGPVQRNRLFMLIRADARPAGTAQILEDTFGSSTLQPLRNLLASGEAGSAEFVVYAGYAGWAPGQLEAEIERGDWHVATGRSEYVFDIDPAEVWRRLIRFHDGRWVEGHVPAQGFARAPPGPRTRERIPAPLRAGIHHPALRGASPLSGAWPAPAADGGFTGRLS